MKALRLAAALLLSAVPAAAQQTTAPATTRITVRADTPGPTYDRRIFTQFAEHLGNGIYGGLWVGEDSEIPNTRGFRNDVVAALKALAVPVVRWPGGCFKPGATRFSKRVMARRRSAWPSATWGRSISC